MACFPRFPRFHRSKQSFNPAEDVNTDTLLTAADNTVKIGKYIRREETPLVTPKSGRHRFTHNKTKTNVLDNNQQQLIGNNSKTIGNNENQTKFISKKQKSNSNNSSFSKVTNSNYAANNTNNTHSKLKPVKERRPTALPTEVPHIDETDGQDMVDSISAKQTEAPTIPLSPINGSGQIAKFFIGNQDDDSDYNSRVSTNSSFTLPQNTTPTITTPNIYDSYSSKKSKQNSTTTSNKSRRKDRTSSGQQQDGEMTHIPPPPPMPPQSLIVSNSTTSLTSMKKKVSRNKSNSLSTAAEPLFASQSNSMLNGIDSNSNHDLQSCTIEEVLNISNSSWLRSTNCPTTADAVGHNSSLNGRDSGVQVEDSISSPKDSDEGCNSPQSHRVEGGLIFIRPQLPSKKEADIIYIQKDETTRNLIRNALEKNDFLNNLFVDKEPKEMVIDAMSPAYYERNSYIIREHADGSEIYVSPEGTFDVIKDDKVVASFGAGTVFGELAILYNAPRLASIKATSYARVWRIDRETFRRIMVISGSREKEENLSFLRSAPFLNDLNEELLTKVVELLQRKFFETDACIVREGELGDEFFIIRGGTVTIKKLNEENVEKVVDRRKRGDYFGEQALINSDRRQASVYADAPGTEVLVLNREAFSSYLGTIPQLREKPGDREGAETRISSRKSEFDNEYAHIQITELKKIATLGAGAFGRVDLVSYGSKTFALKIIKKIDIVKQDQVDHVYSEKHVMMKCSNSPFITELYKTFRNKKFVYFLMEACMGGDVWTIMSQRRYFDEKTARFIAGCVVEAFDFLHSHNIIYRDLKPENLMLTTDGYCKLVDFGFAKHVPNNQKTNTFAGTPEYVAPEIILDRGHDRAVDYWALGILIFELLVGKTPFRGQNQIKIYQQILGGIDVIQMPSKIPKSAQGLIKNLCKQLPHERLGYQRKGILDIKKHSWFDQLDWSKLNKKLLTSPIKRPISSNTDTQYFGPAGVENEHDPPDETSGWDIDF